MSIVFAQTYNQVRIYNFPQETPCTFNNVYQADIGATNGRQLLDGVIDADPDVFSLGSPMKPADYLALPAKIQCTARAGASCDLVGKDAWGNALSETGIDVSSGSAASTKRFSSIDANGITVYGLQNGDNFDVYQDRWGVIWKFFNLYIVDALIVIGYPSASWFVDEALVAYFLGTCLSTNWQSFISVYDNSRLRLGRCFDASRKLTDRGVSLHFGYTTYIGRPFSATYPTSDIELYSCRIYGEHGSHQSAFQGNVDHPVKMYNCIWDTQGVSFGGSGYGDVYRNSFSKGQYGIHYPKGGTFEDILVQGATYALNPLNGNLTLKNLITRQCTVLMYVGNSMNSDVWLVNPDVDNWKFYAWYQSTGKIWRQYEFNAHCQDKNGNNLSGVSAVGEYAGPYGQAFSVLTNGNGDIPTQTIDHGWFDKDHGDTEQLKTPLKVTYKKTGYQTVVKYYPMDKKTVDRVVMHKAVGIFSNFGSPVVNLAPTEPENEMVMAL